jgi:hypothetical protein
MRARVDQERSAQKYPDSWRRAPRPARPRRRRSRAALAIPRPRAVYYIQVMGLIGFACGREVFQAFLMRFSGVSKAIGRHARHARTQGCARTRETVICILCIVGTTCTSSIMESRQAAGALQGASIVRSAQFHDLY